MTAGYEIYRRLQSRVAWVGNEPTRAEALKKLKSLIDVSSDGSTYRVVGMISAEETALTPRAG